VSERARLVVRRGRVAATAGDGARRRDRDTAQRCVWQDSESLTKGKNMTILIVLIVLLVIALGFVGWIVGAYNGLIRFTQPA